MSDMIMLIISVEYLIATASVSFFFIALGVAIIKEIRR